MSSCRNAQSYRVIICHNSAEKVDLTILLLVQFLRFKRYRLSPDTGTFSFRLKADSEMGDLCPKLAFQRWIPSSKVRILGRGSRNQGMSGEDFFDVCKEHLKPSNKACGRHSSGWCSPILEKMNNSLPEKGFYYS